MPPSFRRSAALWLLPPWVFGAALRLFHLAPQILDGDEVHAVRAAVSQPLGAILTTYQESDNCIPLTALFHGLLGAGVRLSEIGFRAPSIVCGLLLLAALPLGVARRLPWGVAAVFAWLLALSPLLFFYSRIARSYLPMTLFALLAAAAFAAWWRTLRPLYGLGYVVAGGLAVWLHLGAAPIVAAPFLYAVGDLAWGRREERGRRLARRFVQLGLLGLGIILALAAFLVPAWPSLARLVAQKQQEQTISGAAIGEVLLLHAGTGRPALALLFGAVVAAGLAALLARDRRLGLYTLTLAAAQGVGIRLLSPLGLASPLILGRYLLPVLPLVLLWGAAALALPWPFLARQGRRGALLQGGLAGALVLALALWGPLAERELWASSFLHHPDFLAFYQPRPRAAAPEPYRAIATAPGAGAVIEFPWSSFARLRTLYLYQEVHRRQVLVSGPQRQLFDPALALANVVAPDPGRFCASGARFLVVHLHVAREEDRIVFSGEERLGDREMRPELRRILRAQGEGLASDLTAHWGDPTDTAPGLRVWDLERACHRPGAKPPV